MKISYSHTTQEKLENNILIVEDDADLLNLLERMISSLGYETAVAIDGEMAMEKLANENFAVVITDINLPKVDGLQLLKHIKKRYHQIEVIVITGYATKHSFTEMINAGATDYLIKPFKKDELTAKLERVFREHVLLMKLKNEINERRQVEVALRESEATLESILMTAPIGIGMVHNRVLIWVSGLMNKMLGYPTGDLIGKSARILYENDAEFERVGVEKYAQMKKHGTGEIETRWQCKDGTILNILLTSSIRGPEESLAGAIFTALDITDRKVAEEALKEQSEKIKLFAYSIVHDLKTPAIALGGITNLLHKNFHNILDQKGKIYCDQIFRSSEEISRLVETINNYISTKENPLIIEKVSLKEILQIVKDEYAIKLNIRQIKWYEPEKLPSIMADKLHLLRSIRNIVDNAIKYGGDDLSKIEIGYNESDQYHIISIKNDGIGLQKEDSKTIFGFFQRIKTSRKVEGTGLGLAIVKEIVERHKGQVWIESGSKRGITFYFSISKSLSLPSAETEFSV
ncbi:MAG: response regulator [Desulfobulbaceae bacterium]|nr:response regulator [Desulfobulbaceae bacterium]